MPTTITYVTTANYTTRVAERANAVAEYANTLLTSYGDLTILVAQAGPAVSNAANAAANAAYAISTALFANDTANFANATAKYANDTATYSNNIIIGLLPIVSNLQTNVKYLQSNVSFLQTNVAIAFSNASNAMMNAAYAISNALLAQDTALFANATAKYANATANIANITAHYANATALYANGLASNANTALIYLSANITLLQSNVRFLQSNVANLYANVSNISNLATYANTTATNANNIIKTLSPIVTQIQIDLPPLQTNVTYLQSNVFILQSNVANATTNAALANALATNAYSLALLANATANIANYVAYQANNVLQVIYPQAQYIQTVFQSILATNYDPLWSNGRSGNIYTLSTVSIGTTEPKSKNTFTVYGNIWLNGNVTIQGNIRYTDYTTATLYTPKPSDPVTVNATDLTRNHYLLNLSRWNSVGADYKLDSNSIVFSNPGLYNLHFNIRARTTDSEIDTLALVNVYTNTNNTLTNATLVTGYTSYTTFGPQPHTLTVPLSVSNVSNNYMLACVFFRNTYPYTIETSSFVEIVPMAHIGIPLMPSVVAPPIYTDSSLTRIGINTGNPLYNLDVTGDVNTTGNYLNNGYRGWRNGFQKTFYDVDGGKVGIGTQLVSNELTVNGNISASQYVYGNAFYMSGVPVRYGTDNVFTLQNLTVYGNITANYISANLSKSTGIYLPWSNTGSNTYATGNVSVDGNIYANYFYGDISKATGQPQYQNWSSTGDTVYVDTPKIVCINTPTPKIGNALTVNGNISANFIYANLSQSTGLYLPFIQNASNNAIIYTNVIVQPTITQSNALIVNGNVYISGRLSAEQVFMVACSDETTPLAPKQNIVTFRTPNRWLLTRIPRATVFNSTTGTMNIMLYTTQNQIALLTSNIYIPSSTFSSANQTLAPPSFATSNIIDDDTQITAALTGSSIGTATGLKLIFYYMNI